MKIEKAIEILTELSAPGSPDLVLDDFDAIKLGIEALQRLQELRYKGYPETQVRLPGETQE